LKNLIKSPTTAVKAELRTQQATEPPNTESHVTNMFSQSNIDNISPLNSIFKPTEAPIIKAPPKKMSFDAGAE